MRVNSVRLGLKKKKRRKESIISVMSLCRPHRACVLSLTHASCDWQVRSPHGEQGGDRLRLREGGREGEEREREREREWGGNLKSLKPIWTRTQVCVNQQFIPPIILISERARGGVRKSGPESKWRLVQGSRFRERIAAFMLYYISKSFQLI